MVRKGKIFERPIVEFLDASESVKRSYAGFLAEIPDSYRGVAEIRFHEGTLTLVERESHTTMRVDLPTGFLSE